MLFVFFLFILPYTGFWCHGTIYRFFVVIDLILLLCATMLTIQLGTLVGFMSILMGLVFYRHVKYYAGMLCRALRVELLELRPDAKLHLRYCTRHYLAVQTRIAQFYLLSNEQFWSRCLLAYFLFNLPVNIYIVSRVLWDELTQFELLCMSNLFLMQIFGATVVMLPHIFSSGQLHQSLFIGRLQQQMVPNLLYLKLKCDTLLQRVSSKPRYEMTIGSYRTVNHSSMLEVSFQFEFLL